MRTSSSVVLVNVDDVTHIEAQSFYGDIDRPPAGTQFDNCYVMLTIEGTGQQTWDDLVQMLVENGWQHPDADAVVYEPGMGLYQDDFILTLWSEDFADVGGLDDFRPTDDGATTFVLDIQPQP